LGEKTREKARGHLDTPESTMDAAGICRLRREIPLWLIHDSMKEQKGDGGGVLWPFIGVVGEPFRLWVNEGE
jgi:hypothetical protein